VSSLSFFSEVDFVNQSSLHVAIIMDGNGRWATRRGWPRAAGHRAGARAVKRVAEAAPGVGVRVLTLYAFSADNWKRPAREVAALMRIFRAYLAAETAGCAEHGVRLNVLGRRDRLPPALRSAVAAAEAATREGTRLELRIAVDYSARDAIVAAAARAADSPGAPTRGRFEALLDDAMHAASPTPPVDLLIRTGGEQRLSDFLLWETAYAELLFTGTMWPDFGPDDLAAAIDAFRARERRFGALPATSAAG
jgi:undecaprenyl diphosphate synthase